MDAEKVDIYGPCDKAIQAMNRDALREFGKLKTADWDQLNVIRTVKTLYRRQAKKAEQRYYEIAMEAYILGLLFCGMAAKEAHQKAEEGMTPEWVRDVLSEVDFVTQYRFDTEVERKAERLAEALAVAGTAAGGTGLGRNAVIDKALRDWSRMFGQYAINVTDYALMAAYDDAGVEKAMWVTMEDERVCEECRSLHGKIFWLDEFPAKPHWNCRCRRVPVLD